MVLRSQNKKKQNNLVVFGVLVTTLLAVFLAGGMRPVRGAWERVWGKLWGSVTIRWEKIPDGERGTAKTPARLASESVAGRQKKLEDAKREALDLVKDLQGIYGVYVEDLETGDSFGINEDKVFPAASLIKLPVFVAVYQEMEKGNLSLETEYRLKQVDKVSGAGSMYYKPAGTVYTYQEVLELMGKQSDNTAQNVFVKLLGEEKIQTVIDGLGMKDTSFADNETTPADVGKFFGKLNRGNMINRRHREQLFGNLTDTIWEDRIPAGVPDEVRVVHKVGTEIGVISDAGVVFGERPFVLVIMSEGVKEVEAKETLPKVASLIYAELNPINLTPLVTGRGAE